MDTAVEVLEVGTWEGNAATWLAAHTRASRVVCVDHFRGGDEHSAADAAGARPLPKRPRENRRLLSSVG